MAGIIEIWRREGSAGMPVRFTIGMPPRFANSDMVPEGPVVANIDYRETGSFAGKRLSEPTFCISFEESFVQRFVPESEVIDIAYETKKADAPKAPALEG